MATYKALLISINNYLDKALAARYRELHDVKVRGAVLMKLPAILSVPDTADHFIWNSWHMGGLERMLVDEGIAYYIPLRYSELPRFYREHLDPVDVVMLQTTPMDAHGNFNFGLNASHIGDMLARAKCIIVEVNENMPWVNGLTGTDINIKDVTDKLEADGVAAFIKSWDSVLSDVQAGIDRVNG